MDCLFCNIVAGTIPATVVHQNEHVVALRDIRPVAPTHVLVIPRRHMTTVHDAGPDDVPLLGHVLLGARDVADKLGLAEGGYRLVINHGADAGQSVLHVHCHVIAGRPMAWPPG